MIIKIDKNDKEILEKACAMFVYDLKFYTIENNKLMLQAEITDMGHELSVTSAYRLGQTTGRAKHHDQLFS